ncbi:MAG: 1-acyl-sn-glycerol-3-phosphate acyltransferase [Clostridiales bacterium]|nr:1-acyl-sn-glycerol-3-phosphate acyltransferase [Clostridiales bacterium]
MCNFVFNLIFKIEIYGLENITDKNGVILCVNHSSNFDPFLLRVKISRKLNFIAKKELFKNKFIGFILSKFGALSVDRNKNDIKSYKKAIDILKNKKEILVVFVQGTRQKKFNENDAKNGASFFALKSNATILPVFIKSKYVFFSKVEIKIGEKIIYHYDKKITHEKINNLTKEISSKIKKLSK